MFEQLAEVERRYDEITERLADPAVASDPERYRELAKELKEIEELVNLYREYRRLESELENTRRLFAEEEGELRQLAAEEIAELEERLEAAAAELKRLLLPKDPRDEKNVIIEIRAGTGGDEAALFAADLYRMYARYAERRGWRSEILSLSPTEIGGIKEIVFVLEGRGAFSRLKFESGVHRVQRVPATEASGRIHTSAATVAVLPEAEEVDVAIDPDDLRIDTFRSGGAGGQHVNKTESAVRITHLPTGLVVSCQDEKSQHKNRDKAMRVLRSRLQELLEETQAREVAENRRAQVGSGDRSERIRTYNFPQGRVTDHRIGLTLHRLPEILDGDLDELLDALATSAEARRLGENP